MTPTKHDKSGFAHPMKFVGRLYVPAVFVALFITAFLLLRNNEPIEEYSLAQCLTQQGVVMYGVDTCNYCAEQKELFGDDFMNVTYKNCSFHEEECREKGITFYPVWSNGTDLLIGTQSLAKLAEFSGCSLPVSR